MMISFDFGDRKFNFRVCGIIINSEGNKILTNRSQEIDYDVLTGGRVDLGEASDEALKREMMEELGVEIEVVALKGITENFFYHDGFHFHELQYMYVVKLLDKSIEDHEGKFLGVEKKDIYEWKTFDELKETYKPSHMLPVIKEAMEGDYNLVSIIKKE